MDLDSTSRWLTRIDVECRRIGFESSEMGALAVTGDADRTLEQFCSLLRSIPDGAGFDEFLRRSRGGWEPTVEQLRADAEPELLDAVRTLVGHGLHQVTWGERARWLRWAADQIEQTSEPAGVFWNRCSFCGAQRGDCEVFLIGGRGGIAICDACARRAAEVPRFLAPSDPPAI